MRLIRTVIFFAGLAISDFAAAQDTDRMAAINGHQLHVRVIDPRSPRPNAPTLVFETGLGDSGSVWNRVIGILPEDLRIITYDRPGLGASEDDHEPPSPRHVASLLHEALQKLHVPPPYVLIGHSFGAARIRMFVGMYPAEVSGLVFVDPTDFTQTREEGLRDVWIPLGLGRKERDEFEEVTVDQMKRAPESLFREFDVARRASLSDYEQFRTLPPMPNVPLVMLVAQQKRPPGMQASSISMRGIRRPWPRASHHSPGWRRR